MVDAISAHFAGLYGTGASSSAEELGAVKVTEEVWWAELLSEKLGLRITDSELALLHEQLVLHFTPAPKFLYTSSVWHFSRRPWLRP